MASTFGGAAQMQAEIEATRAQLAATLDELVDRVSPKKVATRQVDHARSVLTETFTRPAVSDELAAAAGADVEIPYGPREIRWERVAPVAAGAVLVVGLWVWRKRH